MRTLWLVLLTGALAWGLWSVLGDAETPDTGLLPSDPVDQDPVPQETRPRVYRTTGTLRITVRQDGGPAPEGTKAGYRLLSGGGRMKPVNDLGEVRFTDAPLGKLTVVAESPKGREAEQARFLTSGIPLDIVLVLEDPEKKGDR